MNNKPQIKNDHNLPYFPCYIADWLVDTQDLTDTQDGSYFRLVRYQWRNGSIPDDIKIMRRISDCIDDTWPIIKKYFVKNEDGSWYNKRTEKERNKIIAKINAGSKGGSRTPSKPISKTPSKTDIPQTSDLKPKELKDQSIEHIKSIVASLNEKSGSSYKHTTPATQTAIRARLNDGFTVADFELVVAHIVSEWKDDSKMSQYLRPITLFGAKFEGYLQSAKNPVKNTGKIKAYKNPGEDQYKDL